MNPDTRAQKKYLLQVKEFLYYGRPVYFQCGATLQFPRFTDRPEKARRFGIDKATRTSKFFSSAVNSGMTLEVVTA